MVTNTIERRIVFSFENGRILTQTKEKSLHYKRLYSKNVREDLLRILNTSPTR